MSRASYSIIHKISYVTDLFLENRMIYLLVNLFSLKLHKVITRCEKLRMQVLLTKIGSFQMTKD